VAFNHELADLFVSVLFGGIVPDGLATSSVLSHPEPADIQRGASFRSKAANGFFANCIHRGKKSPKMC
jgi:hypothetical protein